MCFALYLGSEKRRPLIAWDEAAPSFHVKNEDAVAKNAATHLRKPHVYYVGSGNGCGCGSRQKDDSMIDDAEQLASKTENQTLLHQYIKRCLADEDSIELYSCWSGDEAQSMEFDRTISVDELIDSDFWFAERQRTIVVQHTET